MTAPIPYLDTGDYIDDDWVDAVSDTINGTLVQSGTIVASTGANGLLTSINFPEAFGATPNVVATVQATATTQQDTAQIHAVNASAVQFRVMRNGTNVGTAVSVTVHWIAIGTYA